jgi:hypothetical protein
VQKREESVWAGGGGENRIINHDWAAKQDQIPEQCPKKERGESKTSQSPHKKTAKKTVSTILSPKHIRDSYTLRLTHRIFKKNALAMAFAVHICTAEQEAVGI